MNPDLIEALIAYMRYNGDLVTAFGDSTATPKFWSSYNALQNADPILPYLVFVEPQETKSYETEDNEGDRSDVAFGVIIADIYGTGEVQVRNLSEEVCGVLNDCDESPYFTDDSLFYFRRHTQAMPPLPSTGPDASPTIFRRQIHFKYMYEENL